MKNKLIIIQVALLFGIGLTSLQAQNTLFLNERSGVQTPYSLTSIKMLTFASGNISVNKMDGSMNIYGLTNIRSLNFGSSGTSSISKLGVDESSTFLLYPNPVIDKLHVQYVSTLTEKMQMQIIDIQGKTILQEYFNVQPGINHANIPVSQFQRGFYLFRFQIGNKLETFKILKN
jgi:hypothetical protein